MKLKLNPIVLDAPIRQYLHLITPSARLRLRILGVEHIPKSRPWT